MAIGNKSLLKSLSVYSLANILNAGIPFLLLPFLTNHLSPADYGLISIFQMILSLTIPFSGLNTDGAVSREYFVKEADKDAFPHYVSNSIFLVIISSLAVLLLFFFTGNTISTLTDFPSDWLWVVLVCAFSQNISEILLSVWQVKYESVKFAIFRITRTLFEMGLSVFLIITIKKGWESRINGQLIAALLFALFALYFLYKEKLFKKGISKQVIKDILKFGVPLIPHVTGAVFIAMADRMFITKMVGISETGLYAVGYQVGQIISLIQTSFNQAWVPYFYGKLNEKSRTTDVKIVKFTYGYFLAMLVLAFGLTICAPTIFSWFIGPKYAKAINYVFWISLGFAFNGMYKMVVNYFFYIKETYWVSLITFITAGINIGLNFVLIKLNGPIGAAQATAIAFFIQFIFIWILSAKKYKMPWLFFLSKLKTQ